MHTNTKTSTRTHIQLETHSDTESVDGRAGARRRQKLKAGEERPRSRDERERDGSTEGKSAKGNQPSQFTQTASLAARAKQSCSPCLTSRPLQLKQAQTRRLEQ
eukprot:6189452-Pleurochrysis_carterae.AAC.4